MDEGGVPDHVGDGRQRVAGGEHHLHVQVADPEALAVGRTARAFLYDMVFSKVIVIKRFERGLIPAA